MKLKNISKSQNQHKKPEDNFGNVWKSVNIQEKLSFWQDRVKNSQTIMADRSV